MRLFAVVAAIAFAALSTPATALEKIEFGVGEYRLNAVLFRPAGEGPFPAVVALHGCDSLLEADGQVRPKYRAWADLLSAKGFAVLYPDSFGSRGLNSQCHVRSRTVQPFRERVADAKAARQWLQEQAWTQKDRVSLLGWSNGAIAALWTVRPQAAVKDENPDFRSAVVLYPGCRRLSNAAWSTRIPTLLLLGAADNWAPARDCEQMAAGARGRSARVSVVKYADAHHGFDLPDVMPHLRRGLAFTPDGSGRAIIGSNAQARNDALRRAPEWLAR